MIRTTVATLLLLATTVLAYAVEPNELANAMREASARAEIEWSVAEARADGDAIVLEDIAVARDGQLLVNLGTMRFEGVTESPDGIRFTSATSDGLNRTYPAPNPSEPEMTLTIGRYGVENGLVPNEDAPEFLRNVAAYGAIADRVFIENLRFERPATVSIETDSIEIEYGYDATPFTFAAQLDNGVFNMVPALDQDAPPDLRSWFAYTGYETLRFGIEMDGSYDAGSGRFDVPTYRIAFEDAATLEFDFAASGMTPELMRGFTDATIDPDAEQDSAVLGMALMGITIDRGSMRFIDSGLTNNLFTLAERQTGQSRQSLKGIVLSSVPVGLGAIGAGDLIGSAFNAANAFLDDPQNLEVSIANDGPVSIGAIAVAAQTDPRSVASLLGLAITANEAKAQD